MKLLLFSGWCCQVFLFLHPLFTINQFLFNKITYFFHWISHAACKYFCWIKWVTNVACWLQRSADARLKLACLAGCVSARSPEILSVFKSLSMSLPVCRHLNGSDMSSTSFWLRVTLGTTIAAMLGFALYRAFSRHKWSRHSRSLTIHADKHTLPRFLRSVLALLGHCGLTRAWSSSSYSDNKTIKQMFVCFFSAGLKYCSHALLSLLKVPDLTVWLTLVDHKRHFFHHVLRGTISRNDLKGYVLNCTEFVMYLIAWEINVDHKYIPCEFVFCF